MTAVSDNSSVARKLRTGDRATLARAITLVESKRADHQRQAHRLVQELLHETRNATRVGIAGSPGGGKSTTIDALGTYLTGKRHKVAVLAVDPSSTRTGGPHPRGQQRVRRGPRTKRAPSSPRRLRQARSAASLGRRGRQC